MSAFEASSIIAFLSLKSAIICFAPTCDAGHPLVGSKTITSEISFGNLLAASVNIIPSCPPPIIPKT